MVLGFDFTSGYATLIYVLGSVLVVVTVLEKVYGWTQWLKRKVRPEPPPPPIPPPVSISEQISAALSYAQDEGAPHRHLARISPRYEIHNGGDHPIKDVTTGVRRRGSEAGGHQFDWYAGDLRPRSHVTVTDVEIPPEMFRDVHESEAQEAFVFWARFTDARGGSWEVTRDAHTKQVAEQFNPPPLATEGADV